MSLQDSKESYSVAISNDMIYQTTEICRFPVTGTAGSKYVFLGGSFIKLHKREPLKVCHFLKNETICSYVVAIIANQCRHDVKQSNCMLQFVSSLLF